MVVFASGPGQSYGFSVFIDPLIEDTGFSRTEISALYAVGTGLSALMVMLVGRLADRYGPRLMLLAVTTGLGLACFGMAFAYGPLAFFLAFAALRALGQGSLPVNGTLLVANWFVRYRGRAIAVMGLGGAASTAVVPPLAQALIDTYGWRETYMILGLAVWLLLIPLALLVVRNRPEDRGQFPDGADEPPRAERSEAGNSREVEARSAIRTRFFWVTALAVSLPSLVGTAYVFHQISILTEFGLTSAVAAGVFVPFSVFAAGSSLVGGYLVDRFGPVRVFTVDMMLLILATIVLLFVSSPLLAFVYAAIMGVFQGIQMVVMGTIWAYFYGRRGLGAVQGTGQMLSIAASAIGPLPLAVLHGYFGDFVPAIAIVGMLSIPAAIAVNLVHKEPFGAG